MRNVQTTSKPPDNRGDPLQLTELRETTTCTSMDLPTLMPALSPQVEKFLTATFLVLFTILFLASYTQLMMILWYKHKRCSYQSVLLYIVLIWATLRIVLFSMYFSEVYLANHLPIFISWLLYCFPVCLQFFTLCLITSFFTSAYLKGHEINQTSKKNKSNLMLAVAALLFFVINITFAILTQKAHREQNQGMIGYLYTRVIINDGLFLAVAAFLVVVIVKLSKVPLTKRSLEAKAISTYTVVGVSFFVILMYGSRALYNMVAVMPSLKGRTPSFGYGWVDVSDQADIINLSKGNAYLSFTMVLTVWELLPLVAVLFFFRVRRSSSSSQILTHHSQYFSDERTSLRRNKDFIPTMYQHYTIQSPVGTYISPRSDFSSAGTSHDYFHHSQLTSTYPPSNASRYGSVGPTSSLFLSPPGKIQ